MSDNRRTAHADDVAYFVGWQSRFPIDTETKTALLVGCWHQLKPLISAMRSNWLFLAIAGFFFSPLFSGEGIYILFYSNNVQDGDDDDDDDERSLAMFARQISASFSRTFVLIRNHLLCVRNTISVITDAYVWPSASQPGCSEFLLQIVFSRLLIWSLMRVCSCEGVVSYGGGNNQSLERALIWIPQKKNEGKDTNSIPQIHLN